METEKYRMREVKNFGSLIVYEITDKKHYTTWFEMREKNKSVNPVNYDSLCSADTYTRLLEKMIVRLA